MTLDRRSFLTRTSALAVSTAFGSTLLGAAGGPAHAAPPGRGKGRPGAGYGPLRPQAPRGGGPAYFAIPAGFTYSIHGVTGTPMQDGQPHPHQLDGAAAFGLANGNVAYLRNSEDRQQAGMPAPFSITERTNAYDDKAFGGVTVLEFDRAGRVVRDDVLLTGTTVNCAGGITMVSGVEGWLTCEETTVGPLRGFDRKHGYCFFVPAEATGAVAAEPFTQMGRFSHEATAQDDAGVVYLTEDAGDTSGFYRYVPDDASLQTGTLQMLAVRGRPKFDAFEGQQQGATFSVEWVDIANPDPDLEGGAPRTSTQGRDQGAAWFNRLEGIWFGQDAVSFASTSGGRVDTVDGKRVGRGQVWTYDVAAETLTMVFESTGSDVLDSPDNLLVTPRGGILLCEDDASRDGDTHPLAPGITDVNRLIGLSAEAEPFEFLVNRFNDAELAGAAFSPDGKTLFFNVFGDRTAGQGFTVAMKGPWSSGPL
jgi:secreted PhoX family phosphatase